MSYRVSQLSPQTSTRGINMRLSVRGPWSIPGTNSQGTNFLRSWLVYEKGVGQKPIVKRINWSGIFGVAMATGVSAGFWLGIGLAVARIWR
jgi:hypothetical protein